MLKLYSYFRSSASYRVRIALHWKELPFEYIPVHLVKDGGQQNKTEYRAVNPMGHVPALDHDGFVVAESMAIIKYLDAIHPDRRLLPAEPRAEARVLQLCELINSGIQPLQNMKVTAYLENRLAVSRDQTNAWIKHWIEDGFANLERLLEMTSGSFCFGGEVTAADAFLVPQCFAARRFAVRIEDYPCIARVDAQTAQLAAFVKAHPERQPDFARS